MEGISKESLCINKIIAEKTEIIFVEGDMIVPDSKPDILNAVNTSGIAYVYKHELQDEKLKIDGGINTYIMYMPEGMEEGIRGINTTLDFSQEIDLEGTNQDMQTTVTTNIKSIETKVINGRKIGIKVALEMNIKAFAKEEIEVVNDITEQEDIQILKNEFEMNSLLGIGSTKIYAKDTVQIDNIDQLAEILKVTTNLIEKDVKISYNKILTKAEVEVKIIYLTEDNRIGIAKSKIPVVGFIDLPNVSEENTYDVCYELKNIIIKPNSQEEHSIYVELEYEVSCRVYENKKINLIQDLYSPYTIFKVDRTAVNTMSNKMLIKQSKNVQETVNLKDIEGKKLIDVDSFVVMQKETKINSKILYEMELQLKFMFLGNNMQTEIKDATIPFEYVVENLERGETLNTQNDFEITTQDFVLQDGGNIACHINMKVQTDMYRKTNANLISSIEKEKDREEQDYSLMLYIVKKDDKLWNIAKEFGSTTNAIIKTNNLENEEITIGQKLYIPKYVRMQANTYV